MVGAIETLLVVLVCQVHTKSARCHWIRNLFILLSSDLEQCAACVHCPFCHRWYGSSFTLQTLPQLFQLMFNDLLMPLNSVPSSSILEVWLCTCLGGSLTCGSMWIMHLYTQVANQDAYQTKSKSK